jgi:hypothetical protein
MATEKIWPKGVKIEVLGLTGDFASGKTLFGLSIDPRKTLLYDFEKSAGTYESLGMERIDVPTLMLEKHPKGYAPVDVFRWWLKHITAIEPGKYSVIVVDTITDIEAGLADAVKANHEKFGFKTASAFQATGGIYWSYILAEWKQTLADLAARCQTFAFTSHLRKIWRSGRPTSAQEPKGKVTLMELCSLYLWLERIAPAEGTHKGRTPDVPSAIVLKSRLADTNVDDDGKISISPLLPPRISAATPEAIRKYILTPPDYKKLKKGEKVVEATLTDDERLQLEAEIAADRKEAEETAMARLERQADLHRAAREAKPQSSDQSSAVKEVQKKNADNNGKLPDEVVNSLIDLAAAAGKISEFQRVCTRLTGEPNPFLLTVEQAGQIRDKLEISPAKN